MDFSLLLERFYEISLYLAVIPLSIGLFRWHYLTSALKVFWFVILASLLVSIAGEWFMAHHINNHFMNQVSTAVDALMMTIFFVVLIPLIGKNRWFAFGLCGLLFAFIAFSTWYWGHSFQISQLPSLVESILIIIATLLTLYRFLSHSIYKSLRHEPAAWILIGVLITNFISVILRVFGSILYAYSGPLFNVFWDTLAPISLLIYYGFPCVGFWKSRIQVAQVS